MRLKNGKATVKLAVAKGTKPGTKKVSVSYRGDRFVAAKTKTIAVRIVR